MTKPAVVWLGHTRGNYPMSRVTVFSDEPLLLEGLRSLTRQLAEWQFWFVETAAELVQNAGENRPDVVLFDPAEQSDLQLIREIQMSAPGAAVVLWVRDI